MAEAPGERRPRYGYPRERRVRKRAEFVRIQSEGARVSTRHFLLLLSPSPEGSQGLSRLGVVASRKLGCAVIRNRSKRLLREAFRTSPGLVPDRVDVVVIIRPGAHELGLADVQAELRGVERLIARRAPKIGG